MAGFGRRRIQRAITRLTRRARDLQDEIDQLESERATLASEAERAQSDATVRPADPVRRDARRARASHDNLQRVLDDRRARLAALHVERDDLLERLGLQ